MPLIHFWSPDVLAAQVDSWDPDAEPQRHATGIGHNLLELFVRLRADGARVELGERASCRPAMVVVAAGSVRKRPRHMESALRAIGRAGGRFVLIRSDTPLSWRFPVESTVEVMPYAGAIGAPNQRWLPPLPQRGLRRRGEGSIDHIRRITIKCNPVTLPPEIRNPEMLGALAALDLDLWVDMPTATDGSDQSWHDFSGVDAVLCARAPAAGEAWMTSKPATKLINSWVAGCIPLVMREPSYLELGTDGEDMCLLPSVDALPGVVERLNADPDALSRLQAGVRRRGVEFEPARVVESWRALLEETAAAGRPTRLRAAQATGLAGRVRMSRLRSELQIGLRLRVARAGRDLLFGVRDATSRIRAPWFWRVAYAALGSRSGVRAAAGTARWVARRTGSDPADLVERASHLFATGWPHHRGTPWVNLNVSRFTVGVKRSLAGATPVAPRRPVDRERLRVGLLANLASTLTFSPAFFERRPDDVDLFVFDLGGRGHTAPYLDRFAAGFLAFGAADTAHITAAIEGADLDLLLFDVYKADIYAILDGVSVPCVVDVCTTVNLRFHPNVSFHLYCLQQADYILRADRMFCATSESYLDDRVVFPGALLFDRRDLDPDRRRPWRDRDPLLVYHGKLYKLSDAYLETVLGLLAEDPALELAVMGRDSDGALERIRSAVRAHGVEGRFHYEGEFRVDRNEEGRIDDPSWRLLADLLCRARLAPDPWPLGGASSRIEAFAAGSVVAHMGVRTDAASWRRAQHAVTADHPALAIAATTVHRVEDYRAVAQRALYDEAFAEAVMAEQAERALALSDGSVIWKQIDDKRRAWLRRRAS